MLQRIRTPGTLRITLTVDVILGAALPPVFSLNGLSSATFANAVLSPEKGTHNEHLAAGVAGGIRDRGMNRRLALSSRWPRKSANLCKNRSGRN
jgi:hypothetical protein